MAITPVDRGTAPDDPAADDLYTAFGVVNANDAELDARPAVSSGSTDPDNGDGREGDLYLRTTTGQWWRKGSSVWLRSRQITTAPFGDVTGAAIAGTITSDPWAVPASPAGAVIPACVRGDGSPLMNVNGGTFATSANVRDGDEVRLRLTASSSGTTARTATLYLDGGASIPWTVTTAASGDSDANAFVSAAGVSDSGQITAINTLVLALKSAGVWSKLKAIYPFVGGSAGAHKWNLKDPRDLDAAYRLTFTGGWTHNASGVTPNGSTGWANTNLSVSGVLSATSASIGVYSRDNTSSGAQPYDFACSDASDGQFTGVICKYSNTNTYFAVGSATYPTASGLSGAGLFTAVRRDGTTTYGYRNATQVMATADTVSLPSQTLYLGASNKGGSPAYWGSKNYAFAFVGDGLTATEVGDLYTAVQDFQTSLGRQV